MLGRRAAAAVLATARGADVEATKVVRRLCVAVSARTLPRKFASIANTAKRRKNIKALQASRAGQGACPSRAQMATSALKTRLPLPTPHLAVLGLPSCNEQAAQRLQDRQKEQWALILVLKGHPLATASADSTAALAGLAQHQAQFRVKGGQHFATTSEDNAACGACEDGGLERGALAKRRAFAISSRADSP